MIKVKSIVLQHVHAPNYHYLNDSKSFCICHNNALNSLAAEIVNFTFSTKKPQEGINLSLMAISLVESSKSKETLPTKVCYTNPCA